MIPITRNQAVKGIEANYNMFDHLLESIDHFMERLDIYITIPRTPAMTEIPVKIMVELNSALALATKMPRRRRLSKCIVANVFPYSL